MRSRSFAASSAQRSWHQRAGGLPVRYVFNRDFFVGQRPTTTDLRDPFLDFPHESIIVIQQALGLAHQRLRVGPALLRKAGELGLLLGRERHFHGSSSPKVGRAGDRRTQSHPARRRHASIARPCVAMDAAGEVNIHTVLGSVKGSRAAPGGFAALDRAPAPWRLAGCRRRQELLHLAALRPELY